MEERGPGAVLPWWERRQLCAESATPANCQEFSFLKLECTTEPNEFGVPTKRCIRLHQRLRHCPGEPPKVEKERQEILTLAGEGAEMALPDPAAFGRSAPGGPATAAAVASARAGEDGSGGLAELLQLAEELHDKIVPGVLELDPEPKPQAQPYSTEAAARGGEQGGILAGLFSGWLQARRRNSRLSEKTWADYTKDFQEV